MRKFAWLALAATFLVLPAFAFAQASGAPAAAPAANGTPQLPVKLGGGLVSGIISGLIGAIATVGVGILKSKDPVTGAQETLDISKAWETLLIGGIIGAVGGAFHLAPADAVSFLTTSPLGAGLVAIAEMAWNAIFRQSAGLVRKTIALFQTGAGANPTESAPTPPAKP